MSRNVAVVVGLGVVLAAGAASAQGTTAPADSDTNVTVQCPARDYGQQVTAQGDVSAPNGDTRDVVNYTLEVPPKTQYNTGLWSFKAFVQCDSASTPANFALPGGRTEIGCGTGRKQLFDLTVNPNSNKTGKVTVNAAPPPGNTGAYAKYTLSFNCNIYRAN